MIKKIIIIFLLTLTIHSTGICAETEDLTFLEYLDDDEKAVILSFKAQLRDQTFLLLASTYQKSFLTPFDIYSLYYDFKKIDISLEGFIQMFNLRLQKYRANTSLSLTEPKDPLAEKILKDYNAYKFLISRQERFDSVTKDLEKFFIKNRNHNLIKQIINKFLDEETIVDPIVDNLVQILKAHQNDPIIEDLVNKISENLTKR